jgi:putative acetyltransferase
VRQLFITVNRLLAPSHLQEAFESYIVRALTEEIDRIEDYYAERAGGFWVATLERQIVGMFGLERIGDDAMELRRMYVEPTVRRAGVARQMLLFAEQECIRREARRLELSTSELQKAALSLYQSAGYELLRMEAADAASNKTIGGGIRRFYLQKVLST